mmetsp:Transcript_14947/g.32848  ORF Transcript_14947/g.32848 Transcript_14947/m.32848 type:complete len:278 (+) Transcript_14947:55-888(+)
MRLPLRESPRLRRRVAGVLALIGAVVLGALPVLVLPVTEPVQLNDADFGGSADAMDGLMVSVQPLAEQVEAGKIVSKFGEKAQNIVTKASEAGPELERAVDGMLQTLFLRQLGTLRRQLTSKFEKGNRPVEAVTQADRSFVAQAKELKRPGSTWSYEEERFALRAVLEGMFRRDAALLHERALAVQTQQSTVEIISKLQSQMEAMQQRVQNMRAGGPWFLTSYYRIPRTPFTVIGRYQQGRANLELNLSPDKDPANAEAGFVQGLGPANLGFNVNVG